jgi:hypothetical protein
MLYVLCRAGLAASLLPLADFGSASCKMFQVVPDDLYLRRSLCFLSLLLLLHDPVPI